MDVPQRETLAQQVFGGFAAAGRTPASWRLAERLIAAGAAGVLAPSYVHEATGDDVNLVISDWSDRRPHRAAVFDPSGRLPKNQLSWP